jgi:hypothetical protein
VVLAIVHPDEEGALYEGIADQANKWIFVHLGQLVLTPLIAAGVWMLLDGIESVAAKVARVALVFWMVFFSAFDAIAGIATGVLTRHANSLTGEERTPWSGQSTFSSTTASSSAAVTSPSSQTWARTPGSSSRSPRRWRCGGQASLALSSERPFSPGSSLPTPAIAASGLLALFLAELLRFGTPSGQVASRRAPSPA